MFDSALSGTAFSLCAHGGCRNNTEYLLPVFSIQFHTIFLFFLQKNDTSCIHVRFFIPKLQLFSSVWFSYFKFHPERIISKMVMYHLSWKLIKNNILHYKINLLNLTVISDCLSLFLPCMYSHSLSLEQ